MYYSFMLKSTRDERTPYLNVAYYVRYRGKKVGEFTNREGDAVRLEGRFTRKSMTKVSNFLGMLKVNRD